jgi:hypothetical protein
MQETNGSLVSRKGLRLFLITTIILSVVGLVPLYPQTASGGCSVKLTVTPTSTSVTRGASVAFHISINSSCGTDHIGWGPSVTSPSPTTNCNKNNVCTTNAPVLTQATYHTSGSGTGVFTAAATSNTLLTTWTITVTAGDVTHCCAQDSASVFLTVNDFTVTASPTSVRVSAGQSANSSITVTGVNGFSGTIYYSDNMPSPGVPPLGCSLEPSRPILSSTTTSVTSILSCSGTKGTYAVTVTGTPFNGVPSRTVTITITVT